ncbi:hypothetical protein GP975_29655, partial [Escherichia coli]|nr:hypothetical protein [Escherichia coli]
QQRYDIISGSQTGNRDSSTLSNPSDETDILSGSQNRNRESIIQPELQRSGPDKTLTDNITRSFMSAMAEQKLKLEITMIDGKGGRREYSAEDGGRITLPMSY